MQNYICLLYTSLQSFRGVVIQIKGTGKTKMFTIRKISNGIGVERIFPLYSPHIEMCIRDSRYILRHPEWKQMVADK